MNRVFGTFIVLTAFAIAGALLYRGKMRASVGTIHFTIPNDFAGLFFVIATEGAASKALEFDRTFAVQVPMSGVVELSETWMFFRWHSVTASYANGQIIPIGREDSKGISLYELSSDGDGRIWHLVGNAADVTRARDKYDTWAPGPVP